MKKRWYGLLTLVTCFLLASVVATAALPPEVDEWLREVKLGPYTEKEVDWDDVYELAKKEGKVVIYTSSSRTISIQDEFEALYPGVKLETYHLGTTGSIDKLYREQLSGIYNADVIHASGYPMQLMMLAQNNMLFPFYPPELEDVIPRAFREPLTAQRYEARGVFYNDAVYGDTPPISSWWELTLPEWKNRILMVDPIVDGSMLDFITTIVINADSLEKEYERFFGKPIKLTTPNAGYELLRGLLDNGVRFYRGHRDVGDIVGDTSIAKPPIGIGMVYSQMRYYGDESRGDLRHKPILDLEPSAGFLYPSLQNIAYKAPHPNAAKLLIRYLHGNENAELGLEPWYLIGNWPARQDVNKPHQHEVLGEIDWPLSEITFWEMDPVAIWELQDEVQDWWILNAN